MRKLALILAGTVTALLAAGCAGTAVHKTAASPAATPGALNSTLSSAEACSATGGTWDGSTCDTSPSPSPSDTLTGAVGTTFTVTAGDGTSYDVTLDRVIQHAALGQYDSLTNYADHAAAAEFTITGNTGQSSDDANSDANVIGSDQVQYQYASLTDLPNFSYGEFKVAPGQAVKGWVSFELPPGASVAQVQWAPSFNGPAATWTVSG
jgi:hypothetical protein